MPIAAAKKAKRASKQPYQYLCKIQRRSRKLQSQKMACKIKKALTSRAITTRTPSKRTDDAACPAEEWTPPTSEPISKALMAMEQKMNEEITTES